MNAGAVSPSIWLSLMALTGGLVLLATGGELLVSGAVRLAVRLGMSSMLIGLTVVAFGTSMPELFVSLFAAIDNHPEIMLGNVVGSNIANVGLILAFAALLAPLAIKFSDIATDLILVIIISFIVAGITAVGFFYRAFGIVFVACLITYTILSYRAARQKNNEKNNDNVSGNAHSFFTILLMTFGGLIMLALGSNFFIHGAVDVARVFGVSELVIGLTLAALGTSLPELASCVSAVRRKESDLVVGNIVGSNLFNLLMVLGSTAMVKPFAMPFYLLWRDLPVMIGFTVILAPIFYYRKRLSRGNGLLLLAAYAAYIVSLR